MEERSIFDGIDDNRHYKPATYSDLMRTSSYATAARTWKTFRKLGKDHLVASAIKKMSYWKGVMTATELVRHSATLLEAGVEYFYLHTDGQRYFFSTDPNYGAAVFKSTWTCTAFRVISVFRDLLCTKATFEFGIYKALDFVGEMATLPDPIESYTELLEYLNESTVWQPSMSLYMRAKAIDYLKDKFIQEQILDLMSDN